MGQTKIDEAIFRGYDIRGKVGSQLTPETYSLLGFAYATFLLKRGIYELVVARDSRRSSAEFAESFINALVDSGLNVYDIGVTPTQMSYFAQYHFLTKGGATITASHLPIEYNGLKLASGFSETLVSNEIEEVKGIVKSGEFKRLDKKGERWTVDIFEIYKEDIIKRLPLLKKRLKVVVDSGGGTTGPYLPKILESYGLEVVTQNCEVDPDLSLGTPDPTEKSVLERLSKKVLEVGADLGFSYDCDGDRMGVVDSKGRVLWNDTLVALFAMETLDRMKGSTIVFNSLCSRMVSEVVTTSGGKPVMWITGHSYIKQKVRETRSPFGGELSGHFFFMDNFYGHDDGAFSSLRLINLINKFDKSLSELVDLLPSYKTSPEIKLGYPDSDKFGFIKNTVAPWMKSEFAGASFTDIDGFRADGADYMLIIRASQNGPYITIKYEAKEEALYKDLGQKISQFLKQDSNVNWSEGVNIEEISKF